MQTPFISPPHPHSRLHVGANLTLHGFRGEELLQRTLGDQERPEPVPQLTESSSRDHKPRLASSILWENGESLDADGRE